MQTNQLAYLLNTIKDPDFVPSINKKTAYSGALFKTFYRFIYFCTDTLLKWDLEKNNRAHLLKTIQEAFDQAVQKLQNAKDQFEISCQNEQFSLSDEQFLLDWKFYILRYVKTTPVQLKNWDKHQQLFASVKTASHLIDLRHAQIQPLPYTALCKILDHLFEENIILTQKEEGALAAWFTELNQTAWQKWLSPKRQLTVSRLHKGLNAFIRLRKGEMSIEKQFKKLTQLELQLGMIPIKGIYLDVFYKDDPKMTQWRAQIEKTKIIQEGVEIEEKLGIAKKEDRHHVYTRKDHPEQVIVLHRHCAGVGLDEMSIRYYGLKEAKYLKCHFIDPKGRFKIMDKGLSLSNIKWQSQQEKLCKEDLSKLLPLCEILSKQFDNNQQFHSMNSSYFIFHENEWKFYFHHGLSSFNYIIVENFLWTISKSNFYVYRFLIKTLNLHRKEEADFLKECALNYLKGNKFDENNKEEALITAAKRVERELKTLIGNKIQEGKKREPRKDIQKIRKAAIKETIQWIEKGPFSGRFDLN